MPELLIGTKAIFEGGAVKVECAKSELSGALASAGVPAAEAKILNFGTCSCPVEAFHLPYVALVSPRRRRP